MFGQVDQQTLFINMMLLVSLLVLGVIGFILLIAAWTGVKIGIWHFRRKRAERDEQFRKRAPDGAAALPIGRGLCSRCGTVFNEVYHLPTGERICPRCYQQFYGPRPRRPTAPGCQGNRGTASRGSSVPARKED